LRCSGGAGCGRRFVCWRASQSKQRLRLEESRLRGFWSWRHYRGRGLRRFRIAVGEEAGFVRPRGVELVAGGKILAQQDVLPFEGAPGDVGSVFFKLQRIRFSAQLKIANCECGIELEVNRELLRHLSVVGIRMQRKGEI